MSEEKEHAFLRWIGESSGFDLEESKCGICGRTIEEGEGRYEIGWDSEDEGVINDAVCENHTDELLNLVELIKELKFKIAEKAGLVKRRRISPSTIETVWQTPEVNEKEEKKA